MSKAVIIAALTRLGQLARDEGLTLEICLYGGALMMLAYDSRQATKDVDAVLSPREPAMRLATRVGSELGLPDNWLNDDVKLFLAPGGATRDLPFEFDGLQCTAPTAGYLLAMKALACRPVLPGYEGDLEDLRFLIRKMEITSVKRIQEVIDAYYPDDVLPATHRAVLESLIQEVWQ